MKNSLIRVLSIVLLTGTISSAFCQSDENSKVSPLYCVIHKSLYDRFVLRAFKDIEEFKNTEEYDLNWVPLVENRAFLHEEDAKQELNRLIAEGVCSEDSAL